MKCLAPISVKNPKHKVRPYHEPLMLTVGCGVCEACQKSKVSAWSFRLEYESKRQTFAHFVTLTYSPEFVPLSPKGLPTLDKKDLQNYFKRLRKKNGSFKYFAVGEYGSRSYRPHYHIIFFDVEDRELFIKAWSLNKNSLGNVHIGNYIDGGAIPYTLKYMHKKGLIPAFQGDDRLKEFRLMSKGMGDNYLQPDIIRWHLADWKNRQYVRFHAGHKAALPRFYREKILQYAENNKIPYDYETNFRISSYMTEEDKDYRTLSSRVQQKKRMQEKYDSERQQEERNKI